MNGALERLSGFAARRWWVVIAAWVVILAGLLAAKNAFGGEYVNNYTISGSDSAAGLDLLNKTFPQQGGYGGLIVFHATKGTVTAQQQAVGHCGQSRFLTVSGPVAAQVSQAADDRS